MLKNQENKSYFYKITNKINGKFYYGSGSKNNYKGSGKLLPIAYNKYGIENFNFEILKFFDTREDAYLFEDKFLKLYKIAYLPNSYNIQNGSAGGDTFTNNPNLEQIKEKLKIAFQLYYLTHDRKGINNNFYGKKHTIEYKRKKSLLNSGTKNSQYGISMIERLNFDQLKMEQFIQKQKIAQKGENNGRYGKSLMSIWIEKYGKEEALKREEHRVMVRKQNKLNKKLNG